MLTRTGFVPSVVPLAPPAPFLVLQAMNPLLHRAYLMARSPVPRERSWDAGQPATHFVRRAHWRFNELKGVPCTSPSEEQHSLSFHSDKFCSFQEFSFLLHFYEWPSLFLLMYGALPQAKGRRLRNELQM